MYKLRVARRRSARHQFLNGKIHSVCFYKKFRTLSDVAKYILSTDKVFFPDLTHELAEREFVILNNKVNSLYGRIHE